MIDEGSLAELMRRAIEDKRTEPEFFRALLDATVYAHVPRQDRNRKLRLIQFTLSSGQLVLPFFSDRAQAVTATGQTTRIIAMTGRQLFEQTRGATLMLNPNGTSCTLYPEEIAALLDRDEMAVIDQVEMDDQSMQISVPEQVPGWLLDPLITLYAGLACVEAAYLVETRSSAAVDGGFLIVLAVRRIDAERVARATTTALQSHSNAHFLDLTTFEPGDPPPWLAELDAEPFYSRRVGQCWQAATETMN